MSKFGKASNKEFVRGYICACCGILAGHGASVEVEEALAAIGFEHLDLGIIDTYDRQVLKEWGFIPRKRKKRLTHRKRDFGEGIG